VSVFGDHQAFQWIRKPAVFKGKSHGGGGLTGSGHENAAIFLQMK